VLDVFAFILTGNFYVRRECEGTLGIGRDDGGRMGVRRC
jgi:hypothetical protein